MNGWLLVAIAIACNGGAQLALKHGASADLGQWQAWLQPSILLGLGLYAVSFILTVRIYALFPLSLISPLMAGAIFVLISAGSHLLLAEPLDATKLAGMALIVAGIALLVHAS